MKNYFTHLTQFTYSHHFMQVFHLNHYVLETLRFSEPKRLEFHFFVSYLIYIADTNKFITIIEKNTILIFLKRKMIIGYYSTLHIRHQLSFITYNRYIIKKKKVSKCIH